jgi:hypothetical protein
MYSGFLFLGGCVLLNNDECKKWTSLCVTFAQNHIDFLVPLAKALPTP